MRGDFCENARVHPKPLCILFFDTMGIQWFAANATLYLGALMVGLQGFGVISY